MRENTSTSCLPHVPSRGSNPQLSGVRDHTPPAAPDWRLLLPRPLAVVNIVDRTVSPGSTWRRKFTHLALQAPGKGWEVRRCLRNAHVSRLFHEDRIMREKNERKQKCEGSENGHHLTLTVAERIANFVLQLVYLILLNICSFKL